MNLDLNKVNIFCYWDKGLIALPPMLKIIYDNNVLVCNKYNMNLHFIDDNNVSEYIDVHKRYSKLKANFKSDLIRYYILHKYGGFWFDCDVIIIKDLSSIYYNLIQSAHDIILDVEYNNKEIGCASICMKPNSFASTFCKKYVDSYLNKKKQLFWACIGPFTVKKLYRDHKQYVILNKKKLVKKGCNFICHNNKPGKNKKKWFRKTDTIAESLSNNLINNSNCFYVITWTIYRKNNIKTDIIDFVFKNKRSIFSYLIHPECLSTCTV